MKDVRNIVIAILLVATAAALALYSYMSERARQTAVEEVGREPLYVETEPLEVPGREERAVRLYFYNPGAGGSGGNLLMREERLLAHTPDVQLMARHIVQELFRGRRDGLRMFPEQARLRQLYVLDDGTAVVDLPRDVLNGMPGGITTELAVIESITRTLRENVSEIRRVRFLVEGLDQDTLAGHVSIRNPFM
ncbi:MAG TPA: GerMN domain-containing protein [Acidobacteriota bacterium]|nr:GerMN domain-containing protein [Acidobacteriota bacterium]